MLNGATLKAPEAMRDQQIMFFKGSVRSTTSLKSPKSPKSPGGVFNTRSDKPVPHARVSVWVSNDIEDGANTYLGGTFTCDSEGDFWFKSVQPTEYSVLEYCSETEQLEPMMIPPHLSFRVSQEGFEDAATHVFVKKSKGTDKQSPDFIHLNEEKCKSEAERRNVESPFWDAYCDVLVSPIPVDSKDDLAEEIMCIADGFNENGELSVSEMATFLQGTVHEPFAKWLLFGRQRNFRKYDTNKDGAINKEELTRAIWKFQQQKKVKGKYYY